MKLPAYLFGNSKPSGISVRPGSHSQRIRNVLVAICCHRALDPENQNCIDVVKHCPDPKIIVRVKTGDALIDRSRSIVASRFLEQPDYDVLFFLDDDIIFDPLDLVKLAKLTYEKDLDIVAGAYMKKQEKEATFAIKSFDNEPLIFGEGGAVREVDKLSTGFMAINRKVLVKMAQTLPLCHPGDLKFYPFFQPFPKQLENGEFVYLSEDWAFCQRAQDLGFKCWVDTTIKLGHAGRYVYTWDNLLQPERRNIKSFSYNDLTERVEVKELV